MSTVLPQNLNEILDEFLEDERKIINERLLFECYSAPEFNEKKLFNILNAISEGVDNQWKFNTIFLKELETLQKEFSIDLSSYTIQDLKNVRELAEYIKNSKLISKVIFPRELICDEHYLNILADAICRNRSITEVTGFVDTKRRVADHLGKNSKWQDIRIIHMKDYYEQYFQIDMVISRLRANDPTLTNIICDDIVRGCAHTMPSRNDRRNFLDPKTGDKRIFALFGALAHNQHLLSINFGALYIDLDKSDSETLAHALHNNKTLVNVSGLTDKQATYPESSHYPWKKVRETWEEPRVWDVLRDKIQNEFDEYWFPHCEALRPILRRNRIEYVSRVLNGTQVVNQSFPFLVTETKAGLVLDIDHPASDGEQWPAISRALTDNNANVVKIRLWLGYSYYTPHMYAVSKENRTAFQDAVCRFVMTHKNPMLREIQSYDPSAEKIELNPKVKQCLELNRLLPFFKQVFESTYGNVIAKEVVGITLQYCYSDPEWIKWPDVSPVEPSVQSSATATLSIVSSVATNKVEESERKRIMDIPAEATTSEIDDKDSKEKEETVSSREELYEERLKRYERERRQEHIAKLEKLRTYRLAFVNAESAFAKLSSEGRIYTPQANSSLSTPITTSVSSSAAVLGRTGSSSAANSASAAASSATATSASSGAAAPPKGKKGDLLDHLFKKK